MSCSSDSSWRSFKYIVPAIFIVCLMVYIKFEECGACRKAYTDARRLAYIYTHEADNKAHLKRLLELSIPILNRNKISYFLDGGTLLGSQREHEIIKHDEDVDLSIMDDEFLRAIKLLRDMDDPNIHFNDDDGKGCKYFCTIIYKSDTPGRWLGKLDIYRVNETQRTLEDGSHRTVLEFLHHGDSLDLDPEWVFPLKEQEFLGLTVKIPKDSARVLVRRYGDDWMTPRYMDRGAEGANKDAISLPDWLQRWLSG